MEELKNALIECLNGCNLPIDEIFYITKDVFRDVADQYNVYLAQKAQQPVVRNMMEGEESQPIQEEDTIELPEVKQPEIEMLEPEIIINGEAE